MIKLFTKAIILLVLLFTAACGSKESQQFDKNIIESISNEDVNFPSYFSSSLFFVRCTSNKIAVMQIQELREIYRKKYSDLKFKQFISLSLNQVIEFNDNEINCYKIAPKIGNVYIKGGVESILEKYCIRVDNQTLKIREGVDKTEINSILYYLFINNYLNFFDDLSGSYYVKKTNNLK